MFYNPSWRDNDLWMRGEEPIEQSSPASSYQSLLPPVPWVMRCENALIALTAIIIGGGVALMIWG